MVSIQQDKHSAKTLKNVVETTVQVWGGEWRFFCVVGSTKTLSKVLAKTQILLTDLYIKKMYQLNIVVHRYILEFQVLEIF